MTYKKPMQLNFSAISEATSMNLPLSAVESTTGCLAKARGVRLAKIYAKRPIFRFINVGYCMAFFAILIMANPMRRNAVLFSRQNVSILSITTLCYLVFFNASMGFAAELSESDIRRIVAPMLQEKDEKIKQLEARIKQLEQQSPQINNSQPAIQDSSTSKAEVTPNPISATAVTAKSTQQPNTKSIVHSETTLLSKELSALHEEVDKLKETAHENGLVISGFFDINAKTDNSTEQTFSVGSIELDLEYDYFDEIAASAAVVLCGNSSGIDPVSFPSAPVAVSCGGSGPGGIGAGPAGFAVAFVDYHRFDHSIPPRGRIFNNQGFHIQAGWFDLPFSNDYQNYANKDRVTITAPITTTRMQFGGFNGDGLRTYGSWKMLNYSVFFTDAMYAASGSSVGGRLGLMLANNAYRLHGGQQEGIEVGISHLSDLDYANNLRNAVYGVDFSFGYRFLRLQSEFMWLRPQDHFVYEDAGVSQDFGYANEFGYHTTVITALEQWLKKPVFAFIRYARWQPKHRMAFDYDGSLVGVNPVSLLSVGLNYQFNDYMRFKFEYTDSLGTDTDERYFDKQLGIAQMVISF